MPLTQDFRAASVTSPLGKDALLFLGLSGTEELGRLFEFSLEVLSQNPNIQANSLLGHPVTVKFVMSNGQPRFFNGYVTALSQDAELAGLARYRLVLRPWLWFLTRATNCRIFQEKKAPDIIKHVLREYGFGDVKENLTESYRQRDYCVQYRETDFDFVSRLMEEEGIYYFFAHQDGKHILNLVDSSNAHGPASGYEKIPYFPPENPNRRDRDHIYAWSFSHSVQSGAYTLTDFDFEKPSAKLMEKISKPTGNEHGSHEQYDYPGGYTVHSDGGHYVKSRLQALQSDYQRFSGQGNAFGLAVGSTFTLNNHPRDDQNLEYLVTGLDFNIYSNQYITGFAGGSYFDESLSLGAVNKRQPFRSAHLTPKPVVRGPQTAIVVGKSGEEIWTDKYGRVKVQFHWDRDGKHDEKSSCWVRVSQPWAGKGWGAVTIPRIGQEVIVDFLEGDPDRPIVTGRVYNGEQTVPYALPANQTQSGIKSRSSKEGGQDNFNEIRMEDKKGDEEIYIHAEKDMNVVVENSETRKVGFDKKGPGNQTLEVFNNRTATLEQGNDKLQIKKGNQDVQLDMGNCSLKIKMGNQETKIDMGKSSTEAMQSIELKVGQSSLLIDQTGVTIKGMMIKIEGTMQTDVKGMMTKVSGDAILTVKGAITMIN